MPDRAMVDDPFRTVTLTMKTSYEEANGVWVTTGNVSGDIYGPGQSPEQSVALYLKELSNSLWGATVMRKRSHRYERLMAWARGRGSDV